MSGLSGSINVCIVINVCRYHKASGDHLLKECDNVIQRKPVPPPPAQSLPKGQHKSVCPAAPVSAPVTTTLDTSAGMLYYKPSC